MAFSFASVASISRDTGENNTDFITSDNTISINGLAAGSVISASGSACLDPQSPSSSAH